MSELDPGGEGASPTGQLFGLGATATGPGVEHHLRLGGQGGIRTDSDLEGREHSRRFRWLSIVLLTIRPRGAAFDRGSTRDHRDEKPTKQEFDDVFRAELLRIKRIRRNKKERPYDKVLPDRPLIGLALSGGGIRSAAFNLGVLQVFANEDRLHRFDYLSTVSGGGYIGCALTWFLSKVWRRDPKGVEIGSSSRDHPLGRKFTGSKITSENALIDHIRGFGNYLRPSPDLSAGSAMAFVLRNMARVVGFWFFPLVFLLLLLDRMVWFFLVKIVSLFWYDHHLLGLADPRLGQNLTWLSLFAGLLTIWTATHRFVWLPRKLSRHLPKYGNQYLQDYLKAENYSVLEYRDQLAEQRGAGRGLAIALGLATIAVAPLLVNWLADRGRVAWLLTFFTGGGGLAAVLATLTGVVASRPLLKEIVLQLGVVLLAIGLLVAAVALPEWLAWRVALLTEYDLDWARLLVICGAGAFAVWMCVGATRTKLNHVTPHRLYRNRLMETFLPDPRGPWLEGHDNAAAVSSDEPGLGAWHPARRAACTPLADMCDLSSLGPYHLINTNVILTRSENSVVRNRGGESFVLSPLYCGCDATDWCKTRQLYRGSEEQLKLATAMAISGAAVSPNTGSSGRGPTRGALISLLMMLFNVRLAYWLPNPKLRKSHANCLSWRHHVIRSITWFLLPERKDDRPRFACTGAKVLWGGMHDEESSHLELSDGGHFDNLGLYELVRRRVPLIVISDCGQDPTCGFADLANAIERVRVDFGVGIAFDDDHYRLAGLQASRDRQLRIGTGDVGVAERGWAVGTIHYPHAPKKSKTVPSVRLSERSKTSRRIVNFEEFYGRIIYIKPSLCVDLPADLIAYRSDHPDFPHETTADQSFDETQLEAYRELGYRTAADLLNELRSSRAGGIGLRDELLADLAGLLQQDAAHSSSHRHMTER